MDGTDIITLTTKQRPKESWNVIVKNHRRVKQESELVNIMIDHDMASLGDSYVNFIYSLALTRKKGKPIGAKAKGTLLAEALRKAGLRGLLPSRMTSHKLADGTEALLIYAWLNKLVTIEESVSTLAKNADSIEGFSQLLTKVRNKFTLP